MCSAAPAREPERRAGKVWRKTAFSLSALPLDLKKLETASMRL